MAGLGGPMDYYPMPIGGEMGDLARAAAEVAAGKSASQKQFDASLKALEASKLFDKKACEQIKDMANNSAKIAALEMGAAAAGGAMAGAMGGAMGAAAEKAKEMALTGARMAYEKSCKPTPKKVKEPLWLRTQEMMKSAVVMAFTEKKGGDEQEMAKAIKNFKRHVRGIQGFAPGSAAFDLKNYELRSAQYIAANIMVLSSSKEPTPPANPSDKFEILPQETLMAPCIDAMVKTIEPHEVERAARKLAAEAAAAAAKVGGAIAAAAGGGDMGDKKGKGDKEKKEPPPDPAVMPIQVVKLVTQMKDKMAADGNMLIPQLTSNQKLDATNGFFNVLNPAATASSKYRALLVGINYTEAAALKGSHTAVETAKAFLCDPKFNKFSEGDDMKILMDDGSSTAPTREEIVNGMKWLVEGAVEGTSLFFYFSGHGGQVNNADRGADGSAEPMADGLENILVPSDYAEKGFIDDDEIITELMMPLKKGVNLTCVMDCYHGGCGVDMPWSVKGGETAMSPNPIYNSGKYLQVMKENMKHESMAALFKADPKIGAFVYGVGSKEPNVPAMKGLPVLPAMIESKMTAGFK